MFYNASPSKFAMSWAMAKSGVDKTGDTQTPLKITICDPVTSPSGDFDDPDSDMGPGDWQKSNAGRLAIQVTQYQEMVIPFANAVIFYILVQQERAELYNVLRMRPKGDQRHKDWLSTRNTANGESRTIDKFVGLANQGTYIIPLRSSWSMRMQSNYLATNDDFKLPTKNLCRIPWKVMGGHKGKD
jgi:hypothetical protein